VAVWEDGGTVAPAPLGRRARFKRRHLLPPTDAPAATVWEACSPAQREDLLRAAAEDRAVEIAEQAVVLAALQRQTEDRTTRQSRWLLPLLTASFVLYAALVPDGVEAALTGGVIGAVVGLLLTTYPTTRARRANEAVARAGGFAVPDEPRRTSWGFDPPVYGDPLLALAVLVAGVWSIVTVDEQTVVTVLMFPLAVLGVGVVLGTVRGLARGVRDGLDEAGGQRR
jgi:hypothetical protein